MKIQFDKFQFVELFTNVMLHHIQKTDLLRQVGFLVL